MPNNLIDLTTLQNTRGLCAEVKSLLNHEEFTDSLRNSFEQADITDKKSLLTFLFSKQAKELLMPHSLLARDNNLLISIKLFFIALPIVNKESLERLLLLNPLLIPTLKTELSLWHDTTLNPIVSMNETLPESDLPDLNLHDLHWLLNEADSGEVFFETLNNPNLSHAEEVSNVVTEHEERPLDPAALFSWQERLVGHVLQSNSELTKDALLSRQTLVTYLHNAQTNPRKQLSAVFNIALSNYEPALSSLFKSVYPHRSLFDDWFDALGCHQNALIRAVLFSRCPNAIELLSDRYLNTCITQIKEGSPERQEAIRVILLSKAPNAIEFLCTHHYLAAFITYEKEGSPERLENISAILSTRRREAINFICKNPPPPENSYLRSWLIQSTLSWEEKINIVRIAQISTALKLIISIKVKWDASEWIKKEFEASYLAYLLIISPKQTSEIANIHYISQEAKIMVFKELKKLCNEHGHNFTKYYPDAVQCLTSAESNPRLRKHVIRRSDTPLPKLRKRVKTRNDIPLPKKKKLA